MAEQSAARLAAHVADTTFAHLTPEAINAAKIFIYDTFACGLAGGTGPAAAEVLDAAKRWGTGDEAAVWGRRLRLPAAHAALVNAYQVHCLEFDCVHEGGVLHPMSSLMAASLADADRQTAHTGKVSSGKDLLTAAIVGIDVACALALTSNAPMRFFRPATAGGFGATAAVAKLRGFSHAEIWNAFGILYGQTSGTMQAHVEGSKLLGLQVGFAARAAITSCDLSASGFEGPKDIITGTWGFLPLMEGDYDLEPTWSEFGRVFRMTEISHKPFPSGRLTHYAVDALQRLQKQHGFHAAEVVKVVCIVPPLPHRLVGRPDIPEPKANYAKLCLGYVCATTLIKGTVDQYDFLPEALARADVHALAAKVDVVLDGNTDMNAFGPQTIHVHLNNGVEHAITIDAAIGHPRNPFTRDRQDEKFRQCWGATPEPLSPENGARLVSLIDSLEDVPDITALTRLMTP
ncbi:MAG: MmgE/PrpD family protein [Rhodospirillaceae bacterium]|nr:MmgE/PrpD family protein [Rhodospirillaceae bacterium]